MDSFGFVDTAVTLHRVLDEDIVQAILQHQERTAPERRLKFVFLNSGSTTELGHRLQERLEWVVDVVATWDEVDPPAQPRMVFVRLHGDVFYIFMCVDCHCLTFTRAAIPAVEAFGVWIDVRGCFSGRGISCKVYVSTSAS